MTKGSAVGMTYSVMTLGHHPSDRPFGRLAPAALSHEPDI